MQYVDDKQSEFLLQLVERIPNGTVASLDLALETRRAIKAQEASAPVAGAWLFTEEQYAALRGAAEALPGYAYVRALCT